MGLELVGERGQTGGQSGGLGGGRSGADRQPDEAAQNIGQLAGFVLAVAESGMILERRGPGVGRQHGAKSTAGSLADDIPPWLRSPGG